MSNRIYYFMFENEYMDDLIKEIREIFSICDNKDEYILSDDKDYVYILNGKEAGKGCILQIGILMCIQYTFFQMKNIPRQ